MGPSYLFKTERLGFRSWQASDREPFAAMNADPEVMRYFPTPLSKERSDWLIKRFEKHMDDKGYGIYAVDRLEDQQFIGFIGLATINMNVEFKHEVEIGWRLDKTYWKKGYAVEGATACLQHAFDDFHLSTIYSFTAKINKPSEKVMERIGMEKIKEFQHPNIEAGNPLKQHILYKISKTPS
ncbi:hypothetical protein M948_19895 [Virgibacillus sp. CM-4]|uniref:GNAT family N-acetyltransferase n=1 Tax=Virgibacillus sp. CM-4 TaxID=1354277 RepID=UPI0003885A2F|nr:GNAT family N-acetyltransferase [Virgibacillus sp. CM-4]EQB34652.1 hypothetical protein M948_19895 [Virgibacillus sp. CM-4]